MPRTPVEDDFNLRTPRLLLRDFREDDLPAVHALRSDEKVATFMDFHPESFEQSAEWLKGVIFRNRQRPRSTYNLAITQCEVEQAVGWVGFGESERYPGTGNFGVGFMLASAYWGRGYLPEALRPVVSYVFQVLGGDAIGAWCFADNTASARAMQKAGFQLQKRYQDTEPKSGRLVDCLEYGLRSDQWRA